MKRALLALLGILAALAVAAALGFAWLAWQVDRQGRRDEARRADAIVVLGAKVDPDGQPGSDLTSRTYHAVDLWNAGYAPRIICTGGFKDEPLSAASVCKKMATKLGVPAEEVFLADGTIDTIGDAQATVQVMETHGWNRAILVSHPLHLYRAAWLFRREGVDVLTSPTTTRTERIYPPLRAWYTIREAGAVVVTALGGWGWLPSSWIVRLQKLAYDLT